MNLKATIFLLLFAVVINLNLVAQSKKIDSLRSVLARAKEDTNKVIVLNKLAYLICSENVDSSLLYSNQALLLATKNKWQEGKAEAYNNLGRCFNSKNDFSKALDHYFSALKIAKQLGSKPLERKYLVSIEWTYYYQPDYVKQIETLKKIIEIDKELGDKYAIAMGFHDIGSVNKDQSDYPGALANLFKSLKLFEEIKNEEGIGMVKTSLCGVYMEIGEYKLALDYQLDALKINEKLKDSAGIAVNNGNIGILYKKLGNFQEALKFNLKALDLHRKLGMDYETARDYSNTGNVYRELKDFDKALDCYLKSLELKQASGMKSSIAFALGNIGDLYTEMGRFNEAEKYIKLALAYSIESKMPALTRDIEFNLSYLYDTTGKKGPAFEHYKRFITLRDSINSSENQKKQARTEMSYEFEKKQLAAQAEQSKKDAVANEERKSQKIITYSVSAGLIAVLLLTFFIFRSYRQKQKANVLITEQKEEVEKQKQIIEEKNKDITDSIIYARRIQSSLLPTESYIERSINRLNRKM